MNDKLISKETKMLNPQFNQKKFDLNGTFYNQIAGIVGHQYLWKKSTS